MRSSLYLFFIFLFSASSISAIDVVPSKHDSLQVVDEPIDTLITEFEPYFQLAIGFSQRTDHAELIDFSLMTHTSVYYHISEKFAGKFSFGYSSSNSFKSDSLETISYNDFLAEVGFRWNLISSRNLTFFHENGFEYHYYKESMHNVWEQRIGVNFALGFLYDINEIYFISLKFAKSFNAAEFATTTKITPQITVVGLKNDKFFEEVFNPAFLQLMFYRNL